MGRRLTRRALTVFGVIMTTMALGAGPALACGGLVGPGGTVLLDRTSTLAAYHDGVEHYVTAFTYRGGGTKFGSIVPLPDVPTDVVKGGDWTLQRLQLEVQPPASRDGELAVAAESAAGDEAEELFSTTVDALDITILRGGGKAVGDWAREHGFGLTPDAPEVLDFYAERSPIFMAASFDATRAEERAQALGSGTPVHLTIPTDNPWVPLRILGLGLDQDERIEADVFLLTDEAPSLLPAPRSDISLLADRRDSTMTLKHSRAASENLLADLRSDRGMEWLPAQDMWLTYLSVDSAAGDLTHDLAVDVSGDSPSAEAAGLADAAAGNAPDPDVWTPSDADRILGLLPWQLGLVVTGLGLLGAGSIVMIQARRSA